ncbi:MAG: hypothetical protein PHC46_04970 [Clostridia bacterium]|jgi:hypothetical protein|nr:hypothetical protein [Clostridia bacterium]
MFEIKHEIEKTQEIYTDLLTIATNFKELELKKKLEIFEPTMKMLFANCTEKENELTVDTFYSALIKVQEIKNYVSPNPTFRLPKKWFLENLEFFIGCCQGILARKMFESLVNNTAEKSI